jgi:tetratricopeptide (TPR) repeat protein
MPESSRAHELLACVYLATRRPAQALPHFEAAARLVPGSARFHALLGELQQDLGRHPEAGVSLRRAVALDPQEPRAHVGLVREEVRLGNLAEAERHARIAFEEAPRDFLVRVLVGSAWARAGQHERALAAYEDAARLDPAAQYAHMLVAIESAQLGRAGAADAARARAGSLGADPDLVVRLGLAFAAAGDPARAAQLLRELEAADAAHPGRARLARVLAGEGGK